MINAILEIVKLMENRRLGKRKIQKSDSNEVKQLIRQWNKLVIRKGGLYRKTNTEHELTGTQCS